MSEEMMERAENVLARARGVLCVFRLVMDVAIVVFVAFSAPAPVTVAVAILFFDGEVLGWMTEKQAEVNQEQVWINQEQHKHNDLMLEASKHQIEATKALNRGLTGLLKDAKRRSMGRMN